MRTVPFLICLLIFASNVRSQYYSTGQDPASIRWKQIKTERYRLIFPEHFAREAQFVANVADQATGKETRSLRANVPRIPFLFHTQSAVSNGLTVWAPRRIELFPSPPAQSYAENWLEQLVIHEYRHAVQISAVNRGFSKVLYFLFGEQITGGILGLYIPTWFLEGDATLAETALTRSGRGRSALFESTLRAQLLEKGRYSYDKATMGSYRTFTPDAYSLGYFLVAQTRTRYGNDAWQEAFTRTAKFPFMVVPFNSGIRKTTGMWKTGLYRWALDTLKQQWEKQDKETLLTPSRPITARDPKNYTDYEFPRFFDDSVIVAKKSSYDDIPRFVRIDRRTGEESILFTPGVMTDGFFSAGGGKIVWAERRSSARWQNKSHSVIRLLDARTGKAVTMTRRSRHLTPAISADGNFIAAVVQSPANETAIEILEASTGSRIRQHFIHQGWQVMAPNWSPDGKLLVFTLLTERGLTLATMDPATGVIRRQMPEGFYEINGRPLFSGSRILFSSNYSGIENIYALDTLTREIVRLTSSRFGATGPTGQTGQSTLVCSDYTSDGAMLAEYDIRPEYRAPLQEVENRAVRLYEEPARQEQFNIQDTLLNRNISSLLRFSGSGLPDSIRGTIYPVSNYSRAAHLFRFHSWGPLSVNAGNTEAKPGVMVLSQNSLSTMFFQAGWEYDLNEETGKFYTGLSYQGLYPVFDLEADYGNRAGFAHYSGHEVYFRFTWQETNAKFRIRIPWNFSSGRWSRRLEPSAGITLIHVRHDASTPSSFTSGNIFTLDYRLTASQYRYSNHKDIYPQLGQSLGMTFRHSPFGENDMGSIFGINGNLYFPGIARHHGIWIYGGYQNTREEDDLNYAYADLIRFPRGYSSISGDNLFSLQANYTFPVVYPDLSAGSVVYLKRIKMNLFYDITWDYDLLNVRHYASTGAELTADLHVLRFLAPLEIGVRAMFFPGNSDWGWELLYAIGL